MLLKIAYFTIFGWPVMALIGIVSLVLMLFTATFPWLRQRGIIKLPFIWHIWVAKLAVAVAIVHTILALSIYL